MDQGKKKNIVVATGIYPPDIGGPATHLAHVLSYLFERGVTTRVVSFGEVPGRSQEDNMAVVRISRNASPILRFMRYVRALYSEARDAQLLYLHDISIVGLSAYIVSRLRGIPMVLRLGGDFVWEQAYERGATTLEYLSFQGREPFPYSLRRTLGTMIARRACAIIVPSKFLAAVVGKWGIIPEKINVVPNAVDEVVSKTDSRYLQEIRALRASGTKVVIAAGRFVSWKHFDLLIDAVASVPDVTLYLVGKGPEEEHYREHIQKGNLASQIHIISSLPRGELQSLIREADVFALPSEGETFSYVALEAYLLGTPLILSREGALEETFGEFSGKGVVFIESITAAEIQRAIAQDEHIPRPTDENRVRLRERYSIDAHHKGIWDTMVRIFHG